MSGNEETGNLIRLLAIARSHLPQTGKAYGVFLAGLIIKGHFDPQTVSPYGYPDDEYFFLKLLDISRLGYVWNVPSHRFSD